MVNRAKVRTKAEVLSIEKALDHDIVGKLVLKHEIHLGKNQVIGKGAEFYNKVILIVPLMWSKSILKTYLKLIIIIFLRI